MDIIFYMAVISLLFVLFIKVIIFFIRINISRTELPENGNDIYSEITPPPTLVTVDKEAEERRRREQEEADERAFWNSPEGRRVRAEQMTSEIRKKEREEAEETATRLAEAEHRRQQEAWKAIKDI